MPQCVVGNRGASMQGRQRPVAGTDSGTPLGLVPTRPDLVAKQSTMDLWGIGRGAWLWATRIRILFVIDGRINTSDSAGGGTGFGLGPVLDTLRDRSWAWWVRFEVDVATRDGDQETRIPWLEELAELAERLASGAEYQPDPLVRVRFFGFRFTQDGFDIDDYDQIWLFGDWPGEASDIDERDDEPIKDPNLPQLSSAELKLLAEWMDRGGGVFATGDHGMLGATLSHRVPRVRKMRRWTHEQWVPLKHDPSRHETLQHFSDPNYSDDETDRHPQTIEPVLRPTASLVGVLGGVPHPLLCSMDGAIDRFPDHMHEGEVMPDSDVELDSEVDITGYEGVEFPAPRPEVFLADFPGRDAINLNRPRPRIIAYGRTTNRDAPSERFGVVGVYDGESVGLGRVVVDSTWHHWFSMNVIPLRDGNPPVYRKLQAYYRNVGLWLATPWQRMSMLLSATWGAIVGSKPMDFSPGMTPWQIGERALDVIGRTAPQCIVSELVGSFHDAVASGVSSVPADHPPSEPTWGVLPADLVNRAVVGGIGAELLELALQHVTDTALGRVPRLDPDAIRRLGVKGAAAGHQLLTTSLDEATRELAETRDRFGGGLRAVARGAVPIPVEVMRIRLMGERLQFPDATDPAVIDGEVRIVVTIRLNGKPISRQAMNLPLPGFDVSGAVVELDRELAAVTVQTGDRLAVEVASSDSKDARRSMRFREVLADDPSRWLGRHVPESSWAWRLWYRVEPGDEET